MTPPPRASSPQVVPGRVYRLRADNSETQDSWFRAFAPTGKLAEAAPEAGGGATTPGAAKRAAASRAVLGTKGYLMKKGEKNMLGQHNWTRRCVCFILLCPPQHAQAAAAKK
jgi:hypothetical protein